MTNKSKEEELREEENPVIKEFREKHAEAIRLILSCARVEWPEHQIARLIYNIVASHQREIEKKIRELPAYYGATDKKKIHLDDTLSILRGKE